MAESGNILEDSVLKKKKCCVNCQKELAMGTRGELCRKCYNIKDKDRSVAPVLFNDMDMGKKLAELTVADLSSIIQKHIEPVTKKLESIEDKLGTMETKLSKMEDELAENGAKVDAAVKDVDTLKNVIVHQQKYLEAIKRKEVENNVIIAGIPNDIMKLNNIEITDDDEKLVKIFDHIDCADKLSDSKVIRLPTRNEAPTHSVKILFKSCNDVKHVINKAKQLKTFTAAKVYINYDEPFYTRRENNRLRKKKFDLLRLHTNDEVKITKGKLYHNNIQVDRFDLSNQLF